MKRLQKADNVNDKNRQFIAEAYDMIDDFGKQK